MTDMRGSKPLRVLAIIAVDFRYSGTSLFLSRCYESIDKNSYSIDIWTQGSVSTEIDKKYFTDRGIRFFEASIDPKLNWHTKRTLIRRSLNAVMDSNEYDVIHVNTASLPLQKEALKIAKEHGIAKRIGHSHCTNPNEDGLRKALHSIDRISIRNDATVCAACSNEAGEYLFGTNFWKKHGHTIHNGIDIERFKFDQSIRESVRNGDNHQYIIVQVGRLSKEKNQLFSIHLIDNLRKSGIDCALWLLGAGYLEDECRSIIGFLGLDSHIRMFGSVPVVSDYLQASDVFLMPSLYEGLPFALIEAQANGLRCVASKSISCESLVNGCDVRFVDLKDSESVWCDEIIDCLQQGRVSNGSQLVYDAGYGIESMRTAVLEMYN